MSGNNIIIVLHQFKLSFHAVIELELSPEVAPLLVNTPDKH